MLKLYCKCCTIELDIDEKGLFVSIIFIKANNKLVKVTTITYEPIGNNFRSIINIGDREHVAGNGTTLEESLKVLAVRYQQYYEKESKTIR